MSRLRRAAAAFVLLMVLASCGTPKATPTAPTRTPVPSPTATPFSTNKLAWTTCRVSFQCAALNVPLDYADPSLGTISIALMRKPATDQAHRIGSLLINPGGPGGSGIEFLDEASYLFGTLNKNFDIVAFDPRGVGQSTPVHCATAAQMDAFIAVNPEPQTQAQIAAAINASRTFANGCIAMSSRILGYVGTANAARDMDSMRVALGDAKLSYIGFSYGTLLGATYASLFPTHVRALVLDGAVDPSVSPDDVARSQAAGFESNLTAFLASCAARASCSFYNGGSPEPALDALFARVEAHPIKVGTRSLGIGEAYLGVLAALYSPSSWDYLALALHDAQAGSGSELLTLADSYDGRGSNGNYTNELDANTAINCDDGPTPGTIQHLEQLAVQLQKVSPHFGTASAFGPVTCDFWPIQASGRGALSVAGIPPVLVIGGTNDPATPYVWAQGLARQIQGSILVTRTGDGHVSYDKSQCVRNIANAYLLDPTQLPKRGTVCSTA